MLGAMPPKLSVVFTSEYTQSVFNSLMIEVIDMLGGPKLCLGGAKPDRLKGNFIYIYIYIHQSVDGSCWGASLPKPSPTLQK